MTRQLMELSIAVFFVVLSVVVGLGGIYAKDLLNRQILLSEKQIKQQAEILASAQESKEILIDVGYTLAARALEIEGDLAPSDADEIANQSIKNIESKSERMGLLIKAVNNSWQKENLLGR